LARDGTARRLAATIRRQRPVPRLQQLTLIRGMALRGGATATRGSLTLRCHDRGHGATLMPADP
jgi:hypothetical protein